MNINTAQRTWPRACTTAAAAATPTSAAQSEMEITHTHTHTHTHGVAAVQAGRSSAASKAPLFHVPSFGKGDGASNAQAAHRLGRGLLHGTHAQLRNVRNVHTHRVLQVLQVCFDRHFRSAADDFGLRHTSHDMGWQAMQNNAALVTSHTLTTHTRTQGAAFQQHTPPAVTQHTSG